MKRFKRKTKSKLETALMVLSCLMIAYVIATFIPAFKDLYSSTVIILGEAAMITTIILILAIPRDFDYEIGIAPNYIFFQEKGKESKQFVGKVQCKMYKKSKTITLYGENWESAPQIGYNKSVIEYLRHYNQLDIIRAKKNESV